MLLLDRDRERLLERQRKAIAYAKTDPENALVEVRKALELFCKSIMRQGGLEPAPADRADKYILQIAHKGLVPDAVESQLRALQHLGNYGSHDRDDAHFLDTAFVIPALAALDVICRWYLEKYFGENVRTSTLELSGLFSLADLAASEQAALDTDGDVRDARPTEKPPDSRPTERPPDTTHGSNLASTADRRRGRRPSNEPASAGEWTTRADEHLQRDEVPLAVRSLSRAIHFLLRDGDILGARLLAERITEIEPEPPQHWIQLAELLVSEGAIDASLDVFKRAASILLAVGDLEQFVAVSERIAVLHPNDVAMMQRLAGVYITRRDGTRAMRTISRCIHLAPGDPDTLALLASAYELQGDRTKAEDVRRRLSTPP
jgi:tetratricopeptide (TPR) repeat protein